MTATDTLAERLKAAGRIAADGMEWAAGVDEHTPLRAVPSWGRDGWDLGRWPLVVVALGEVDGSHVLAVYVEGDVYVSTFEAEPDLVAAVDREAWSWWESEGNGPDVSGYETLDDLPAELRGPFSWERLDG